MRGILNDLLVSLGLQPSAAERERAAFNTRVHREHLTLATEALADFEARMFACGEAYANHGNEARWAADCADVCREAREAYDQRHAAVARMLLP